MWAAYRDVPSLAVMSMLRQNRLTASAAADHGRSDVCPPAPEVRPAAAAGENTGTGTCAAVCPERRDGQGFGLFLLLSVLFAVLGFSAAMAGVDALCGRMALEVSLAEASLHRESLLRLWGLGTLCLGLGYCHLGG